MAFSLIEKTDLLKKVRLPSEKAELQSALDSGGDKAKISLASFLEAKTFNL